MKSLAIGSSGQSLMIADDVLSHFDRHRQTRCYHREAGGQLFASFDNPRIVIRAATGPRRTDKRTRYSYVPDRVAEQKEIEEHQRKGMFYVGDWHTHPEQEPQPSPLDIRSICDCFARSRHELNGFVLIIVGISRGENGLYISIHDGKTSLRLAQESIVKHEESLCMKED